MLHNLVFWVLCDFFAYECRFEIGGNRRVCSFDLDMLVLRRLLQFSWLSSYWNLLAVIGVKRWNQVRECGGEFRGANILHDDVGLV